MNAVGLAELMMRLLQFDDDTQRNMSKRKRAEEINVPEIGQLDAMIVRMPSKMEGMMAEVRDQCKACVDAAKNSIAEAEQLTEAMKEEISHWEEEKKRIASTRNFDRTVTLNVGGQTFTTTTATLTNYPDTMLGAMFSGRHALIQDKNGTYFIDRDGRHFHEILNFLRGSTASTPESLAQLSPRALEELKVEADFYGMKELMFPPPPPFKPADLVVIKSIGGCDSTVTQGEDQLWYIKHSELSHLAPQIVTVCNHCGLGSIKDDPTESYDYAHYSNFTTGRIITDAQPRIPGACPTCKQRQ